MSNWDTVFRALQTLFAAYGLVYLATAVGAPSWFLENLSVNRADNGKSSKAVVWFRFGMASIGLGVLIYASLYALIAAIPYSWGSHNEDGDWDSTRDAVRLFGTIFGTLGLFSALERNAEVLVWGPFEKKARRALEEVLYLNRDRCPAVLRQARERVAKELSGDEFEVSTTASKERDEIKHSIVNRLMVDDA